MSLSDGDLADLKALRLNRLQRAEQLRKSALSDLQGLSGATDAQKQVAYNAVAAKTALAQLELTLLRERFSDS